VPTLTAWRRKRIGPPFYQIGRLIRYSPEDLLKYLGSRRRGGCVSSEVGFCRGGGSKKEFK